MQNIIIKYFYKEIKVLTKALTENGLPKKLFEAAKAKKESEVWKISSKFQMEDSLWYPLSVFYRDFESEHCPEIFDEEGDKRFVYDPKEISPEALYTLIALSSSTVTERDLFLDKKIFINVLREYNYTEIANEMEKYLCRVNGLQSLVNAYYSEELSETTDKS